MFLDCFFFMVKNKNEYFSRWYPDFTSRCCSPPTSSKMKPSPPPPPQSPPHTSPRFKCFALNDDLDALSAEVDVLRKENRELREQVQTLKRDAHRDRCAAGSVNAHLNRLTSQLLKAGVITPQTPSGSAPKRNGRPRR